MFCAGDGARHTEGRLSQLSAATCHCVVLSLFNLFMTILIENTKFLCFVVYEQHLHRQGMGQELILS